MPSYLAPTVDELMSAFVDITNPQCAVEVLVSRGPTGASVLHVNIDGVCVLRVCGINLIMVNNLKEG